MNTEELRELYNNGKTYRELAMLYECNVSTIYYWLIKREKDKKKKDWSNPEEYKLFHKLYVTQGKTIDQIASELGVSIDEVNEKLEYYCYGEDEKDADDRYKGDIKYNTKELSRKKIGKFLYKDNPIWETTKIAIEIGKKQKFCMNLNKDKYYPRNISPRQEQSILLLKSLKPGDKIKLIQAISLVCNQKEFTVVQRTNRLVVLVSESGVRTTLSYYDFLDQKRGLSIERV